MTTDLPELTWPALLAHWTEFARSSLALPKTAEGDRWRAAVPAIIGLQAVTFALADLERLAGRAGERGLALDRAEMLIRRHTSELQGLWRDEPLHMELSRLIADAQAALAAAADGGVEWRVTASHLIAEHPAELVEQLISAGFDGTLLLPAPGFPILKSAPAAFARGRFGETPPQAAVQAITTFLGPRQTAAPVRVPHPRQVYRQFDFAQGGPVRDLVGRLATSPVPAGQPLLVAAIADGEPQPVPLPPRRMMDVPGIPVIEAPLDGP